MFVYLLKTATNIGRKIKYYHNHQSYQQNSNGTKLLNTEQLQCPNIDCH